MPTSATRVFMNGNSQAVRIPQEFRLDTRQVEISRTEQGDLLIHPLPVDRGAALLNALVAFDEEFAAVLEEDRSMQPVVQEREPL
uniref:Antitoxin VapB n=1 Tax=Candidatus Kentrum sp. DK TaxID=2126562 RepID=A0A450TLC0_9GAMM|nr:MAG: antitoxin VapB [Candidatus Kentron sp. DK]VFJ68513.1 MAG: antitoxin VapB [Candidatus Kentron sp. DK]